MSRNIISGSICYLQPSGYGQPPNGHIIAMLQKRCMDVYSNYDLFFDEDTNTLLKHIIDWEVFNKNSMIWRTDPP